MSILIVFGMIDMIVVAEPFYVVLEKIMRSTVVYTTVIANSFEQKHRDTIQFNEVSVHLVSEVYFNLESMEQGRIMYVRPHSRGTNESNCYTNT